MDNIDTSDVEDLRDDTDHPPSLCRMLASYHFWYLSLCWGRQTVAHPELDLQIKGQTKTLTCFGIFCWKAP